jgi:hypothetical protein
VCAAKEKRCSAAGEGPGCIRRAAREIGPAGLGNLEQLAGARSCLPGAGGHAGVRSRSSLRCGSLAFLGHRAARFSPGPSRSPRLDILPRLKAGDCWSSRRWAAAPRAPASSTGPTPFPSTGLNGMSCRLEDVARRGVVRVRAVAALHAAEKRAGPCGSRGRCARTPSSAAPALVRGSSGSAQPSAARSCRAPGACPWPNGSSGPPRAPRAPPHRGSWPRRPTNAPRPHRRLGALTAAGHLDLSAGRSRPKAPRRPSLSRRRR